MKKLKLCAACAYEFDKTYHCHSCYNSDGKYVLYVRCKCGIAGPECETEKRARRGWNKQQRQPEPQEWTQVIRDEIVFLYRTIGRQMWLDYLMPGDIVEIRDHIMPVFQNHLEMRKLTVQPETELRKVKTDNLQLKITIEQLRERNEQLEIGKEHPHRDCWCAVVPERKYNEKARRCLQLVEENRELRQSRYQVVEQLSQAVEFAEQAAAIVLQVVGELGKRE